MSDMETRLRDGSARGFALWMQQPLVRRAISEIPGKEDSGLTDLLHAAFEAGAATGQGMMISEMLTQMTKDRS